MHLDVNLSQRREGEVLMVYMHLIYIDPVSFTMWIVMTLVLKPI